MVIYDSVQIIPAPMLRYNGPYTTRPDGTKIGQVFSITIAGTLVAYKGSPDSAGSLFDGSGYPSDEVIDMDARLHSIEAKQQAILQLFANDGRWLEWMSPDGSTPLRCQPRIKDIQWGDGSRTDTWTQICEYTIDAEADILYMNGVPYNGIPFSELISDANESWEIADGDVVKTFKVTHSIKATGKRGFDDTGVEVQPPWKNARDFVFNRLGIGFAATTSYSPLSGQDIFNTSSMASGSIVFDNLNAYNFARNETIDEMGGSYSLTENWTMASGAGTDVYSISVKKISDQPQTTTEVGIQGTIKGFYTDLNDYDTRNVNAAAMWADLKGDNLYNRVQTYADGVTLNTHALTASMDVNPLEGTIAYNYQFSDRSGDDYYEDYVVSQKRNMDDYRSSVSVQGKITGRRFDDDTDVNAKYDRAVTRWNIVKVAPFVYNRIIDDFYPELSGVLRVNPVDQNFDMNKFEGVISYSYTFDTRRNEDDIDDETVLEEFSISSSYSREDGKTNYGIQGTVKGLAVGDPANPQVSKYAAASGYFESVTLPNLTSRINEYAVNNGLVAFNAMPLSLEIERNVSLGIITYNYHYNNINPPCVSGALSEVISVSDDNWMGDVNVFAEIPIPRRGAGPIFQDMSTTKRKVRTVSIETVMPTAGGCNWATLYGTAPDYESKLVELKPGGTVFIDTNTKNWDWVSGRYSRSISWVYQ